MADSNILGWTCQHVAALPSGLAADETGFAQIAENAIEEFLGDVIRRRDIGHEGQLTRPKSGQMNERFETVFSLSRQH
jgi:hypothetical protein